MNASFVTYSGAVSTHRMSTCTGSIARHWLTWARLQPACAARQGLSTSSGKRRVTTAVSSKRTSYDVAVVGIGAFGSSAAYHLAKLGYKVVGLDPHPPGHSHGSSHGLSRIIRLAYHEGVQYVKLIRRSYDLFRQLENEVQQELLYTTGMLDLGGTFEASLLSVREYSLPHEVLTGADVNQRFPGYQVPEDWKALYQPHGGVLYPEKVIQAHCQVAQSKGADIRSSEALVSWRARPGGAGVELATSSGATYTADQLILSPGAWMAKLVPETKVLCVPERQVVAWFDCSSAPQHFRKESFPVFIIQDGSHYYYGFPEIGGQPGFKFGVYGHLQEVVDPDHVHTEMTEADEALLRMGVQAYFPTANGAVLRHNTCLFTNTLDKHFIIDRHPSHPQAYEEGWGDTHKLMAGANQRWLILAGWQVVLCSACSGHGFKMSGGIGQLLADMVVQGGAGSPNIQEELSMHRISAQRPGHADFIAACHASAA